MLTQSERHTITSQVLNQLIRDGIVGEPVRAKAYRRVRKVLVESKVETSEALRKEIARRIEPKGLPA